MIAQIVDSTMGAHLYLQTKNEFHVGNFILLILFRSFYSRIVTDLVSLTMRIFAY